MRVDKNTGHLKGIITPFLLTISPCVCLFHSKLLNYVNYKMIQKRGYVIKANKIKGYKHLNKNKHFWSTILTKYVNLAGLFSSPKHKNINYYFNHIFIAAFYSPTPRPQKSSFEEDWTCITPFRRLTIMDITLTTLTTETWLNKTQICSHSVIFSYLIYCVPFLFF